MILLLTLRQMTNVEAPGHFSVFLPSIDLKFVGSSGEDFVCTDLYLVFSSWTSKSCYICSALTEVLSALGPVYMYSYCWVIGASIKRHWEWLEKLLLQQSSAGLDLSLQGEYDLFCPVWLSITESCLNKLRSCFQEWDLNLRLFCGGSSLLEDNMVQ